MLYVCLNFVYKICYICDKEFYDLYSIYLRIVYLRQGNRRRFYFRCHDANILVKKLFVYS